MKTKELNSTKGSRSIPTMTRYDYLERQVTSWPEWKRSFKPATAHEVSCSFRTTSSVKN